MEQLKSCPFCGGKPSDYQWIAGGYEVECDDCHASVPGRSKIEAVQAWNRRPDPPPAITRSDDTISGKWRLAGRRIATAQIYEAHNGGWDTDRIIAEWHGLTPEQVALAVEFERERRGALHGA